MEHETHPICAVLLNLKNSVSGGLIVSLNLHFLPSLRCTSCIVGVKKHHLEISGKRLIVTLAGTPE